MNCQESPEKTFTFSLVYIPIIISIKSQLKAEVEVTGSLEMSASTGFEASGNAKFGVKYEKPAPDVEGDWALVNELGWNWNYKPPVSVYRRAFPQYRNGTNHDVLLKDMELSH